MFKAIREDNVTKFKQWLETYKWTPNTTGACSLLQEYTIFTRCVRMGAKRCFEWCLRNGADVNLYPRPHGLPALAYAVKNMYFFRALIRIPTLDIETGKLYGRVPRHIGDDHAREILDGILNHPNYYPDDDDATNFLSDMLTANRRVAFEYLSREYRYNAAELAERAITAHDENAFAYLLSRVPPERISSLKIHAVDQANTWALRALMRVNDDCDDFLLERLLDKLDTTVHLNMRLEMLDEILAFGLPRGGHAITYVNIIDRGHAWEILTLLAKHGHYIPDNTLFARVIEASNGIGYSHDREKLALLLRYILCYRPAFDLAADGLLRRLITAASTWEQNSTRQRLGGRRYVTARSHDPDMVEMHELICDLVRWHYQNLDSSDKKQKLICLVHKTTRTHPIIGLDAVLEPYIGTL